MEKKVTFIDTLKDAHAKSYHGTDDDMPDAFDAWLVELPVDTLIAIGELAVLKADKQGFTQARDITFAAFKAS